MSELGLNFAPAPAAPDTFNVLLYGPPGCGKTTAAATAVGPIMFVNFEGPGALAFARKKAAERGTQIHEVRIEHGQDPRMILRQVVQHIRSGAEPRVATLAVDTIGKVRDSLAAAIGGDKPSLQQWGQIAKEIDDFVRAIRDLPVNVVLLAHEDVSDDEEGRLTRPMIGGKQTEKVLAEMDVVGYCGRIVSEEHGTRFVARVQQTDGRRAKDRSDGLGTVRDLDLAEWLQAFRAALSTDAEPMPWDSAEPVGAEA